MRKMEEVGVVKMEVGVGVEVVDVILDSVPTLPSVYPGKNYISYEFTWADAGRIKNVISVPLGRNHSSSKRVYLTRRSRCLCMYQERCFRFILGGVVVEAKELAYDFHIGKNHSRGHEGCVKDVAFSSLGELQCQQVSLPSVAELEALVSLSAV